VRRAAPAADVRARAARQARGARRLWPAIVSAALLVGCGAARPEAPGAVRPGDARLVIPLDADPEEGARLVAGRARAAEVVYLGELHDNPDHHAVQARILRALLATGARPALAFEMVPETRQAALAAAVRSDAGPEEVDRQLGWRAAGWPSLTLYWPLFELARGHGLPVFGIDLDPAVTRRINRGGLGAAGEDPARLRSALPDDPARDRGITRRLRAAHCHRISESQASRMLQSWYARNVVIARRLVEALAQAPQVVVIIGRGHQSPGGVPEQLAALRPGTRQLAVALVEGRVPEREDDVSSAEADVVWVVPARERPDYCRERRDRLG
jgi:uncharacterized iron-regulated protein